MKIIENISISFFVLIPIALITGPLIPDIFISCLGVYFLIELFNKKLWYYLKHPFFIFSIFFYLFLIFSSLFSIDPYQSLESSLFYFRYIFFVLAIVLIINKKPKSIHYFGISLILTLIFVTFDAYYQYFQGFNLLGIEKKLEGRLSGVFGDEYILGSYLARLMPLFFFYLAFYKKTKSWMMWLAMTFLILVDILIYLSAERTAFFYLILLSLSIIILTKNFKYIRMFAFSISLLLLISCFNVLSNFMKR